MTVKMFRVVLDTNVILASHLLDLKEDYRVKFEIQVLKPIPFLQQVRESIKIFEKPL